MTWKRNQLYYIVEAYIQNWTIHQSSSVKVIINLLFYFKKYNAIYNKLYIYKVHISFDHWLVVAKFETKY